MEACLEALLEIDFCTKPPNFEVEAHIEAPTGVALVVSVLKNAGDPSEPEHKTAKGLAAS
jgi:hypothetical protein